MVFNYQVVKVLNINKMYVTRSLKYVYSDRPVNTSLEKLAETSNRNWNWCVNILNIISYNISLKWAAFPPRRCWESCSGAQFRAENSNFSKSKSQALPIRHQNLWTWYKVTSSNILKNQIIQNLLQIHWHHKWNN